MMRSLELVEQHVDELESIIRRNLDCASETDGLLAMAYIDIIKSSLDLVDRIARIRMTREEYAKEVRNGTVQSQ